MELVLTVAVTVMLFGVGGNSGAVNNPVAGNCAGIASSTATPFTDHVSAGLEPSLVLAVNCWLVSALNCGSCRRQG